ncbi:hypothetical protein [Caballeronia novacaledonica]|uniref:hypothetical protein n=1 Tax=Caballeronia novacaledonica TaxID=1544861 RepID=UPI0011B2314A|nr:hypothetical protein [Caballeronia novacaledonica]
MMPLKQRVVLEALKRRRHATIRSIAEDLEKSRDVLKHTFASLEGQGYVERLGKSKGTLPGPQPDMYRWTGKSFPPSSEITAKVEEKARVVATAVDVLIAGMQAMCRVGRIAA